MWEDRIRKEVQQIALELTTIVNLANGRIKMSFVEDFRPNFQSLLPLPTSVYLNYLDTKDKLSEAPASHYNFQNATPDKVCDFLRIYSFMILRRIGYDLHQNLFNESDITLVKKVRETFGLLFPVIEDKSPINSLFAERSS